MMLHRICTLLVLLFTCSLLAKSKTSNEEKKTSRQFPPGFLFGVATASYQIEGSWDVDGKSESIWDYMTHNNPSSIIDGSNGDIADDSYNQYKRDVEMLRELGVNFYRFSISWPRIIPTSFPDKINEAGVQYYNNLINELLKYNITPMVTLYHWDLPQKLQDMGGWTNPHIVDWFGDYSRVAFDLFGDRVKHWITMNEPRAICYQGYGNKMKAPAVNIKGIAEYLCAKYLLLAHARAYHIYDKDFRSTQNGTIGITISAHWYEELTESDAELANEVRQFGWGQYAHPIFSETGDFPEIMREKIAAKSSAQGFARSRLPEFTPEEVNYIKGTSDFFGLNHYTTFLVYRNESVNGLYEIPSFYDDMEVIEYQPDDWVASVTPQIRIVPWGFYKLLTAIRKDYNNPTVMITENGFASTPGVNDTDRITYYRTYLSAMLDAIEEGSHVTAFTAWSLMDNFEWTHGYMKRFGLYEVDYESPERTCTPRKSAFVFKEILRTRTLDFDYEPDMSSMTIEEGH